MGRLSIALIVFVGILSNVAVSHVMFAQDLESSPELPEVSIQAILLRDSLEIEQSTQLNIIVTNKSNMVLRNVLFSIIPESFTGNITQEPNRDIPPFGSVQASVVIRPDESTGFGKQTLVVTVRYSWGDETEFISNQAVTVDVTIKRKFEDELGGLLSGGAALLYFVLPIYPAIAAYKIVEILRKGEDFKIPSVDLANVVPGAIASIAANLAIQPFIGEGDLLDFHNFFSVIGGSLAVGALFPAVHLLWDKWQEHRWGYTGTESDVEMLRKTLTRPHLPKPDNSWVKVTIGTDSWEGFFLEKRKNACVIGAILMASVENQNDETFKKVQTTVLDEEGKVHDAKQLIKLVKQGTIRIQQLEQIKHKEERIAGSPKIITGTGELIVQRVVPFVKLIK